MLLVADFKLGGVNTDCDTPGTGGDIIAGQRPLMPFIQLAVLVQGQRMSRNNKPLMQSIQQFGG
ncbi:hypothetical protein D3C73_1543870 [compost metagenome]